MVAKVRNKTVPIQCYLTLRLIFLISLESFPVFSVFFVVHHGQVGLVAALGYIVFFYGFEYGASRFVGVRTVGEPALLGVLEYLLEIAGQFLGLHVKGSEALDARCVDEPAVLAGGYHLAEGGGVHACVVGIADIACAQVLSRYESVDEC